MRLRGFFSAFDNPHPMNWNDFVTFIRQKEDKDQIHCPLVRAPLSLDACQPVVEAYATNPGARSHSL